MSGCDEGHALTNSPCCGRDLHEDAQGAPIHRVCLRLCRAADHVEVACGGVGRRCLASQTVGGLLAAVAGSYRRRGSAAQPQASRSKSGGRGFPGGVIGDCLHSPAHTQTGPFFKGLWPRLGGNNTTRPADETAHPAVLMDPARTASCALAAGCGHWGVKVERSSAALRYLGTARGCPAHGAGNPFLARRIVAGIGQGFSVAASVSAAGR